MNSNHKIYSDLWDHDRKIRSPGGILAGIDEVGRGPLAGNVVSACVVLDLSKPIGGVRDSKKISEGGRNGLFPVLKKQALYYGIGMCTPAEIDKINILQATFLSMKRALKNLGIIPDFLLVDGNKVIPDLTVAQKCIVKGDGKSACIAAASIIAKVTRDNQMKKMHKKYPEYDFIHNKGYGSKKHIQSLSQWGASPIHRKSFQVKSLSQMDLFKL